LQLNGPFYCFKSDAMWGNLFETTVEYTRRLESKIHVDSRADTRRLEGRYT